MSKKASVKEVSKIGERDPGRRVLKEKDVWIDKTWSPICFTKRS